MRGSSIAGAGAGRVAGYRVHGEVHNYQHTVQVKSISSDGCLFLEFDICFWLAEESQSVHTYGQLLISLRLLEDCRPFGRCSTLVEIDSFAACET